MLERKKKTLLFIKERNVNSEITTLIQDHMKCEPESYKNSTNALETRNTIKPENNKPNLI